MENSKQIWLIRHGETEWSRTARHTGRSDIALTDAGERRAQAIGQILAPVTFGLVLTSPLVRARETCRLAGFGDQARVRPDLAEWDYGTFEGRTTSEIQREHSNWSIWQTDVPGGESMEQVAARAEHVIEEALAASGNVALFAHGHILRILTARWLGLPALAGRLFALDTGSTSVLGYEHATQVIRTWNRT